MLISFALGGLFTMNIGIILPYRVSEAIQATSALKTLRQNCPEATRLVGVMTSAVAEFLGNVPWLSEVQILEPWSPSQSGCWLTAVKGLRQSRWDEWLVMSDRLPDRLIPWMSTARAARWLGDFWGRGFVGRSPLGEMVDPFGTFGDLLQTLGAPFPDGRPQLNSSPAEEAELDAYLQEVGIGPDQPLAIVGNGTEDRPSESWPAEYFAILSRRLVEELDFDVVACPPQESPGAESAIVERANCPRVHLGMAFGRVWKPLVRRASLVITTDLLLRQVASAFQTPTVMLFGPQDMRFDSPTNKKEIQIQLPLACSPCGRAACPLGHLRCQRDLTPTEVLFAVRRHLGRCPERIAA